MSHSRDERRSSQQAKSENVSADEGDPEGNEQENPIPDAEQQPVEDDQAELVLTDI